MQWQITENQGAQEQLLVDQTEPIPFTTTHYVQAKWKQICFTQKTDPFQSFQMLFGSELLAFESRTILVIYAIVTSADHL